MFFESIRESLKVMIEDIAKKDGTTKKAALLKCQSYMNTLSKEYYSGRAPALAYEDPSCRWAYMYTHVAANADVVKRALEKFAAKDEDFASILCRDEIKVCVVGGGPGSEILAFAKYYSENPKEEQVSLSFYQIDRIVGWSENTTILKQKIHEILKRKFKKKSSWPVSIDANFVSLDLSENSSFAKFSHIFNSDIAVLCYVVSEIFDFDAFKPLLKAMKEGANGNSYVMIIDRSDDGTKEKIEKVIKRLGAKEITKFALKTNLAGDEQGSVVKDAFADISRQPRLTWDAVGYLVKLE